jgi:hypothetical protein
MLEPAVRRLADMEDDVPSPVAAKKGWTQSFARTRVRPLCAAKIMLLQAPQVKVRWNRILDRQSGMDAGTV